MSLKTDCLALCTLVNLKRRAKYYQLANQYSELAIQRMFRELTASGYVSTVNVPEAELTPAGKQKLRALVYKKVKMGKFVPISLKMEGRDVKESNVGSVGGGDHHSGGISNHRN